MFTNVHQCLSFCLMFTNVHQCFFTKYRLLFFFLTSYKSYWIEDQLADVSTRFYTSASWRRQVGPSDLTSAIPGDISLICNNLPKVHVWKLLHDKIFYCKVIHLTLEINLNNISNLTSNDLKALTNSSTSLCEYLPFVHTYT